MPKFLIEASYTAEGLRGLMKDKATGRQAVVKEALASIGGKLESAYFALGENDVLRSVRVPRPRQRCGVSVGRIGQRPGPYQDHSAPDGRGSRSRT